MRSGRSHGRTTKPPPVTLQHVRVTDGSVDTDEETAGHLAELIAGEARAHLSGINVSTNAVLRDLAATVLADADSKRALQFAALTDDQFWHVVLSDYRTAADAQRLRDDPLHWTARVLPTNEPTSSRGLLHEVRRLYLGLPLVDGEPHPTPHTDLPSTPVRYEVVPRD